MLAAAVYIRGRIEILKFGEEHSSPPEIGFMRQVRAQATTSSEVKRGMKDASAAGGDRPQLPTCLGPRRILGHITARR
jgi:hypothetical protein